MPKSGERKPAFNRQLPFFQRLPESLTFSCCKKLDSFYTLSPDKSISWGLSSTKNWFIMACVYDIHTQTRSIGLKRLKHLLILISVICLWRGSLWGEGRLVLHSNVPGAEVYLDGNLIATTNAAGNLQIDQLPDGRFLIALRKSGFESREQSIEIHNQQILTLRMEFSPIRVTAAAKSLPKRSREAEASEESSTSIGTATTAKPIFPQLQESAGQNGKDAKDSWSSNFLYVLVLFVVAGLLVSSYFLFKHFYPLQFQIRSISGEVSAMPEDEERPADSQSESASEASSANPEFLTELEHREELLRAGFLPKENRRQKNRKPMEEPTITLKKDEYEIKN